MLPTRGRRARALAGALLTTLVLLHAAAARADSPDGGAPAQPPPADGGAAEPERPADAPAARVTVGLYVNGIRGMSLRENQFEVDFWVWFRWKDEGYSPIESFEIIGGQIDSREGLVQEDLDGGVHYAAARVRATITQNFDVSRFPLDDHTLRVLIEDSEHENHELVYVPDEANSRLDPTVQVPGWTIGATRAVVGDHEYRTNYGDTSLPSNSKSTYSRFELRIELERQGAGYVLKLFWSLYLATLIALLAFFIKPTDLDPRFGLGIGAIFAAMASAYVISTSLPETSQMTVAEKVVMIAIAFIFLSLVGSTVSLRVFSSGREETSRKIDTGAFRAMLAVYVALNVLVLL
ncbi:MAG: hypothetical protein HYY06_10805 [Deltaproteobacteria bacterium]|nr:hypothetical protein [Deltaproteobacteria bacterium]